jgi:Transcription factor TFIID complex subunit 8 C-term
MLSARRTAPMPTDFESAIRSLNLPWPDDQLKPFTIEPIINPSLLPTPPPEDAFHREFQLPASILGPGLNGRADEWKDNYIPSHLPPFPSQHTYKDTPVFPEREVDPRRIRELATEEGKLGEEALRKLAGAVKAENTISTELETRQDDPAKVQKVDARREEAMDSMFEATMRNILKSTSDGVENRLELGPIVNCEKRFLMQDSAPTTRRRPPDQTRPLLATATAGPKVTLSEKARGKQRAEDVQPEEDML